MKLGDIYNGIVRNYNDICSYNDKGQFIAESALTVGTCVFCCAFGNNALASLQSGLSAGMLARGANKAFMGFAEPPAPVVMEGENKKTM